MKTATIVGAGLVGSLWSVYLSKAGYKVKIFERRDDIRNAEITAGKSINLSLSDRGFKALSVVGIEDEIRSIGIPMHGRSMHDDKGNITYQPYGQEGQAIYSTSRGGLNAKLMDIAESTGNVEIFYNEKCIGADLKEGIVKLQNSITNKTSEYKSDVVFATDGAFSAIRTKAMQRSQRFNYSQNFIEDGYRELLLPANEDGTHKLDKNVLHIWPRGRFMLIALANDDGSFTCTLFMPYEGYDNSFDKLNTRDDVDNFFKTTFPDFYDLMPNVADTWGDYPLSSLAIMRSYPWKVGKGVLMGDAAHATVPFYGQGMNSGFEDCYVMWELMQKHNQNWEVVLDEFQKIRKPDGDAVQDLSMHNYKVMSELVADPKFLLQKRLERRIQELYPEEYLPLYSMVTFSSEIRYSTAMEKGFAQDEKMRAIIDSNDIAAMFENNTIDTLIHQLFNKESV